MIRATETITTTESLLDPTNDWELLSILYSILNYMSDSVGAPLSSNWYSVLKRHVPSALYSGPGFRFIGLETWQTVQVEIHNNEKEAELYFPPDVKKALRYFKNYESGRYQSWAQTIHGIESELGKQTIPDHVFVFKANVSNGIVLKLVAEAALDVAMTCLAKGKGPYQIVDIFSPNGSKKLALSVKELLDSLKNFKGDFSSSEEIVAPMPNQVNLIGYYDGYDARDGHLDPKLNSLKMTQERLDRSLAKAWDMDYKIIKQLLDWGADPNTETGYSNERPLELAIANNDLTLVKMLIGAGASLNFKCSYDSDTPLMYAARHATPHLLKILIDDGKADVNETGIGNWTALMAAVFEKNWDNADYLYSRGAKLDIKNEEGETVLDMGWNPPEP
jgi:hypothetical protein